MNHFNKIQELRQTQIREFELKGELQAFLKLHLERIRKYKNGDKVEVFKEGGQSLGVGIIAFASLTASLDSFIIAQYGSNPDKYQKEINEVHYRVNKMKKDGSMSTHRLATCHENPGNWNNTLKLFIEESSSKS
jgi:predicted hydrocarbon binding protein